MQLDLTGLKYGAGVSEGAKLKDWVFLRFKSDFLAT